MQTRVCELLDSMKGTGRRGLLKYLPEGVTAILNGMSPFAATATSKGVFPSALSACLDPATRSSTIGLVTEALVLGSQPLTIDSIVVELASKDIALSEEAIAKLHRSKTMRPYFSKIAATRASLAAGIGGAGAQIVQGETITYGALEGCPDGVCGEIVIEVEISCKPDKDIAYFLLQLCSYVALGNGAYQKALLVLPLQQTVLSFEMRGWGKRTAFRDHLVSKVAAATAEAAAEPQVASIPAAIVAENTMAIYGIGHHVSRAKTLLETVKHLPPAIPFQIFLGGNQSSRLAIKDADLAAAANHVATNGILLFIHSPYIINISATPDSAWNVRHLGELLRHGAALGAKGVVVHTGKHTKDTYETGVAKMRTALAAALEYATPECPLLLETPAGQGTETLKDRTEFLDFVASFESAAIAVCVDTCHVFACGHDPLEYLQAAQARGFLRLVHFNDSEECCGSCKDRHAMIGAGKIGIRRMEMMAEYCIEHGIPMLYE